MKKIKFLFFVIILQCSSLYADANLQAYVESVSYEKGELLCYSVAYPLYLQIQSGRIFSGPPISSRQHLFWRDVKYRRAMLEWMFLAKDAFEMSLGSRADESLATLYAQYPMYLVASEGFQHAIEDCSKKYYPKGAVYNEMEPKEYEDFLQNQIREMVLFSNKYIDMTARVVAVEVSAIVGLFRVIRGLWRGIKWLYRITGNGYRHLRGITSTQTAILQTQKQQFESMTRSFFHFTRGEIALGLVPLLGMSRQVSVNVSAHYESVQEEVFEQEIRDRPSTRLSPLPERLFHHRIDESLYTRLEVWWNTKIEDYRVLLIQKGLDVQRLEVQTTSETHLQSAEFYIALNEYRVWVDMYLVDYWLVKGVVEWFRKEIAENQVILFHHRRSYEILRMTLQVLELRKGQLEKRMEELENGHAVNVNYDLEHLKTIFTIIDQSRDSRYSPYNILNYLPYGYCLSMEDYRRFVFTDMSDREISEMQEWQLCRLHKLQTTRRLGKELNDFEEREFRQILQMVREL